MKEDSDPDSGDLDETPAPAAQEPVPNGDKADPDEALIEGYLPL